MTTDNIKCLNGNTGAHTWAQ